MGCQAKMAALIKTDHNTLYSKSTCLLIYFEKSIVKILIGRTREI